MAVSQKQLVANRRNGAKGGVKTAAGKEIVKYNALKHGLLAREAVITIGEGAENPDEFAALLDDLTAHLQPEGSLEEMLVEKIAVAYWRLRRAYRYESGLIRRELDTATDDFYSDKSLGGYSKHKTDAEIDADIESERESLQEWKKDKRQLTKMFKAGKPLEDIYDWEGNWDWLHEEVKFLLPDNTDDYGAEDIRKALAGRDWSDEEIWEKHIEICDERISSHAERIEALEKQKQKNRLRLQVIKQLGNIPSRLELDRLLRYEGSIERQFYKALNQLERLQRMRIGDRVPAPLEVDVNVDSEQND